MTKGHLRLFDSIIAGPSDSGCSSVSCFSKVSLEFFFHSPVPAKTSSVQIDRNMFFLRNAFAQYHHLWFKLAKLQ